MQKLGSTFLNAYLKFGFCMMKTSLKKARFPLALKFRSEYSYKPNHAVAHILIYQLGHNTEGLGWTHNSEGARWAKATKKAL